MITNTKPKIWTRFIGWIRRHPKASVAIGAGLVLLIGGGVAWALLHKPVEAPAAEIIKKEPAKPAPKYYSPLTGIEVADQTATTQAVTAVMIENSPDARPQSGLKNSGVVFEAIAEGGITRFLALYQQEKPQLIGPVRSLRIYYIDWLAPFEPSVAHVGGSYTALSEIRNGNYRDIDQFFNAGYYWRATDRWAPHNVYTNFDNLDELNQAKGYTTSDVQGFSRQDSEAAEIPTASLIDVNISSYLYNSHYDYNAETNTYDRSQAGGAHLDREDGQISPRVVIVLKIPMALSSEDGYHQQYSTIGSGEAFIFQDGTVQQVTWNKVSSQQQITFTDAAGEDVPLARGQTWITAVPADTGGVSWQ